MLRSLLQDRIVLTTATLGMVMAAIAASIWGMPAALAALVSGTIATANWMGTRFLSLRATSGSAKLLPLMMLKTAAVGFLCWLMLSKLGLHAYGFLLGMTGLMLGPLVGSSLFPEPRTEASPPPASTESNSPSPKG